MADRTVAGGPTVLIVEDDADLRIGLVRLLHGRGLRTTEAIDAAGAIDRWNQGRPDMVLLDLGLPDADGISVVRRIRREATTPILILSAREREADKVAALEAGADDYVTKPFGAAELLARIGALLRRAAGPAADPGGTIHVGPLALDVGAHRVTVDGALVALTPREFQVLHELLRHPGRLVTHGRLLRAVWGTAYDEESHYLHVHVSNIRRKLAAADPGGRLRGLLVAEPGLGYRVRDLGEEQA